MMRPRLSFRDRVYLVFLLVCELSIIATAIYWWRR